MNTPRMYQYWQSHVTSRPFAIGTADDGSIWFGSGGDTLFHHDPRTGHTEALPVPELKGRPLSQCVCLDGAIYILMQLTDELLRYDVATGRASGVPLPAGSSLWLGDALPERHQIVSVDRARSQLVLIEPEGAGVIAEYRPEGPGSLNIGHCVAEENVMYVLILEPARIACVDLDSLAVSWEMPAPEPAMTLCGMGRVGRHLFLTECYGGRLHALDTEAQRWEQPVALPGYGELFGFAWACNAFAGHVFMALSSLDEEPVVDFTTNQITAKRTGLDGKPHHFLDRQLVYDPANGDFDFVVSDHGPESYPLLCYSAVAGHTFIITGCDIAAYLEGHPTRDLGRLLVLQSKPAMPEGH